MGSQSRKWLSNWTTTISHTSSFHGSNTFIFRLTSLFLRLKPFALRTKCISFLLLTSLPSCCNQPLGMRGETTGPRCDQGQHWETPTEVTKSSELEHRVWMWVLPGVLQSSSSNPPLEGQAVKASLLELLCFLRKVDPAFCLQGGHRHFLCP